MDDHAADAAGEPQDGAGGGLAPDADAIEAGRRLFAAECRFFFAAQRPDQLPPPTGPEIAFAGRSNVGKSSLVNALTGRRALARASNQPGRTRQLNFFDLGGRLVLVEIHPLYNMVAGREPLALDFPYAADGPRRFEAPGSYADRDAEVAVPTEIVYAHALGEVVTAAIAAGLREGRAASGCCGAGGGLLVSVTGGLLPSWTSSVTHPTTGQAPGPSGVSWQTAARDRP